MEQFYLSSAQHCAKSVLYEIIPTNLLEALEILEHLHGCTVTFDEESQNMPVWLTKVVLAQHNCSLLVNGVVMLYTWIKECTKYIRLPLSISDSPIIMIGPNGLILVVPHLSAIPVSVLWLGLLKSK
jgi:hypothetical protein